MTALFLAMLTVIVIVAIARYYGSPKVANDLMITLALSVVVGLGIKHLAMKVDKKDTRIEKVTSNYLPMRSTANFATVADSTVVISAVSQSGIASKDKINSQVNWKGSRHVVTDTLEELDVGNKEILDSS